MGYRRLSTLTDIARAGYWLLLTCPCGHQARHDPLKVARLVTRRGAPTRLDRLQETLKCGKCGGKLFSAEHCEGPPRWSPG